MAAQSTMIALGTQAPEFSLHNAVDGRKIARDQYAGQPLLVMFICNHCPYVVHVRSELGRLARDYGPKGLAMVAINSNSTQSHPEDGPENMKKLALSEGWPFPFLFDETQQVARSYHAVCTPEFYLFDRTHTLRYRGQLDDSRPGSEIPVTGKFLRAAIDAVLAGTPVNDDQKPSVGCSIKWRSGNEPDYVR
jgi:peroxiredoxin